MAKPADHDLAIWLAAKIPVATIANMCGEPVSTMAAHIAEFKAKRGQHRAQTRARARTDKSRGQLRSITSEMLDIALEVVRAEELFTGNARDMIARGRFALEIRAAVLDSMANAPNDTVQTERPELLERVKNATASARAKLRAV